MVLLTIHHLSSGSFGIQMRLWKVNSLIQLPLLTVDQTSPHLLTYLEHCYGFGYHALIKSLLVVLLYIYQDGYLFALDHQTFKCPNYKQQSE